MLLYDMARKVNAQIKRYKKAKAGKYLSPVRRIEFVCPPTTGRYCAMTFDDGPCALSPNPSKDERSLTGTILDILKEFNAKATFDVVGSTAENYPDEEGNPGDFTWSGVRYDHYPKFGADELAGAFHQPELIRRILDEGHEVSNHGYTHRLFGPMRAVYGKRHHFQTLSEVVDDLSRLHALMKNDFSYEMTLARPAHYIDNIPQGGSAYDAYRILGYNYMAASFDGAGWQPCESYEMEVQKMVTPLKEALERDPDSLNGKIIFQKDGSNMSLRTPVADALGPQLKLLKEAGYQVITVSQLLSLSPFEDVGDNSFEFPYVRALLKSGHVTGYRNNTFQGARAITKDEFYLMLCPPEILRTPRPLQYDGLIRLSQDYVSTKGIVLSQSKPLGNALLDLALSHSVNVNEAYFKDKSNISRAHAISLIAPLAKIL